MRKEARSAGTPGEGLTRRATLLRFAGALAGAWLLERPGSARGTPAATTAAAGFRDADYWAFADRCQPLLDALWSEQRRSYAAGGGETSFNANMLFTHAAAARAGHAGPSRQDQRARRLARRLCESPPWRPGPIAAVGSAEFRAAARAAADQTHPWGWGHRMQSLGAQHAVIDTAVMRGLAQAWLARNELDLPESTVVAIRDRVRRCAYSTFYRFPALRLNQINWPVEIYAWEAIVHGDPLLLRQDSRRQLGRFADALTRRAGTFRIPFTGPGYRFHYLPQFSPDNPTNIDSAEYATIVCGVLQFYEQARRAGMRPLSRAQIRKLRAWVDRVLCGYWTHGGYLNWDTGLSFRRWHQGKKLGAQPGGIARDRRGAALPALARVRPLGEALLRPRPAVLRSPDLRERRPASRSHVRRHAHAWQRGGCAAGHRPHAGQRRAGGDARARQDALQPAAAAVRL